MRHVQWSKEREAHAEGGWKKTTDSESGISLGSVAPAAVENQMTRKSARKLARILSVSEKRSSEEWYDQSYK